MYKYLVILILFSFVLCFCDKDQKTIIIPSIKEKINPSLKEPIFVIDSTIITDFVELITSKGILKIGLYGNDAPITVDNFLGLVKRNYYNGVLIHRVARDFIIQTGDGFTRDKNNEKNWGYGGESIYGHEFADEINENSALFREGYIKGTVAMANSGKNSNKSQFFFCLEDAMYIDHNYTIFGRVISGIDVLDQICDVEVIPSERGKYDGLPKIPIKIINARIINFK
ncbi:MAG: peptidylprolyl isomerase [Candidatus Kapabacteria bacterium]|nr:peptidylprolyl isomerase [Candidatus Kapabacteria bacterium]